MKRSMQLLMVAAALCAAAPAAAEAATAPGQVFFPNPVQSLEDESLTDQQGRELRRARGRV